MARRCTSEERRSTTLAALAVVNVFWREENRDHPQSRRTPARTPTIAAALVKCHSPHRGHAAPVAFMRMMGDVSINACKLRSSLPVRLRMPSFALRARSRRPRGTTTTLVACSLHTHVHTRHTRHAGAGPEELQALWCLDDQGMKRDAVGRREITPFEHDGNRRTLLQCHV